MNVLKLFAVLVCLIGFAGCSEETVEKTGEAVKKTGEAVESAAKDAAQNTKTAAEAVEDSIDTNDTDNE